MNRFHSVALRSAKERLSTAPRAFAARKPTTIVLVWLLMTCWCGWCRAAEMPNVLMILVDDLKPVLGCYGDPVAKTPHMDRLAARGMRFDLAYCNQAVCAPSRFTLLLGSHSTSTGLYGLGSQLRQLVPDAVTLPQHFAKYGYRTEPNRWARSFTSVTAMRAILSRLASSTFMTR
ncbi:MAG TPA: sulfatase-like hydrolase/transferase [Pirellulaceae bacterium]|nr:sulfatase-like hydrolase/transferase [Pirellulaceae bacterium]